MGKKEGNGGGNERESISILVDARALGRRPSGIGIYLYNLVRELRKDEAFSISFITDVCESEELKRLQKEGFPVCCYKHPVDKSFSLFPYFCFVQKYIRQIQPDMFWEINNLVPIPIRNPYGILASTIHDMFPVQYPEHFARGYKAYFTLGLNITARCFDLFIYNSIETKQFSEQYFPKLKTKNSFVGFIAVPRLPEREVSDNNAFLYVGNLETRKGTDILIHAFRIYKKRGGTMTLRLAGKVRDQEVELLLKDKKNNDGIEYLGYISEEQKCQEYSACHAFLFPSRAEGFGIPIIEAMNYTKPILVLDLPIYHEIVGESIGYVHFDPGEEAEAFCRAMENVDKLPVDRAAYERVINAYDPENIGILFRNEIKLAVNRCGKENRKKRNNNR